MVPLPFAEAFHPLDDHLAVNVVQLAGAVALQRGAAALTRPAARRSAQKAAGTFSWSAATSSAIREGRVAPGMPAAETGWAREN